MELMPIKLLKKIKNKIFKSIAFYPVLISLTAVLLACFLLYVENLDVVTEMKEKVPYLIVQDEDTARTILSVLFSGILSLTVFSFTMVMVVLNQASSNFSPRLLPGLVSNKKHQAILGCYIGTLLFTIIVLMSMGAYGAKTNPVGFSVMVAALFGASCVGLFVYFIHSISQAIQIDNIIDNIFSQGEDLIRGKLKIQQQCFQNTVELNTTGWTEIVSKKTGYFNSFETSILSQDLIAEPNVVVVLPYTSERVWKGTTILKTEFPLNKAAEDSLLECIYMTSSLHEDSSIMGTLTKLSEVAVRALSPGINDPGTAINAISKIGELLIFFKQMKPVHSETFTDSALKLMHINIAADEIMRKIIQPIRLYGKADNAVSYELLKMLQFLKEEKQGVSTFNNEIEKEITKLVEDLRITITNKEDLNCILQLIEKDTD